MDGAAAIDADLPDNDPLATAFMAYRKVMDSTAAMSVDMLNSTNPVNAVMGDHGATGLGVNTERARIPRERIWKGCRKSTKAAATATKAYAAASKDAHPAFVNSDGTYIHT